MKRSLSTMALLGLLLASPAGASEEPRFVIGLGAFFSNLSTEIRLDDPESMTGTTISLESSLGLADSKSLPTAVALIHVAGRHGISFRYFDLNRTAQSTTDIEIRFEDEIYPINTDVNVVFDTSTLALSYDYSFIKKDKWQMALQFGLHVTDVGFGLTSLENDQTTDADVTAPLPTLGFRGGWGFANKWRLDGSIGVFGLEISDFKGSILDAGAAASYRAWKHVGFALSYNYYRVDVESKSEDWLGEFMYEYHGPTVWLMLRF